MYNYFFEKDNNRDKPIPADANNCIKDFAKVIKCEALIKALEDIEKEKSYGKLYVIRGNLKIADYTICNGLCKEQHYTVYYSFDITGVDPEYSVVYDKTILNKNVSFEKLESWLSRQEKHKK